jgi:hypothetical protein
MNIEQTKEAIRVMQAFVDGKGVIYRHVGTAIWDTLNSPKWNWDDCEYRIKPTPVLRPWTADEVPLGAWVRMKNLNLTRSVIVSVAAFNLGVAFKEYEHSTDGGKTWKECGVMEEAK